MNLLCRAKRVDNGEWIEGWYSVSGGIPKITCEPNQYCDNKGNLTLASMQYTVIAETVETYGMIADHYRTKKINGDLKS